MSEPSSLPRAYSKFESRKSKLGTDRLAAAERGIADFKFQTSKPQISIAEFPFSIFDLPSLIPEDDPPARQVVRRKLDGDLVSGKNADEVLPHLTRDVRQD